MKFRDLCDEAFEATIVASFASSGYLIRRRLFRWADPAPDALAGKTVAVTGPTSGLGRATAFALAGLGARVLLLGRSRDRLADLRTELIAVTGADRFPPVVVDMSSLASVRAAVESIRRSETRLDVLVDNAGAIFPVRSESVDGIEATLATMVVGPFVLIDGLLPLLSDAPGGGRVVSVTSGGMYTQGVKLHDLEWRTEPFSGPRAYARAKRMQVALMREWARRTDAERVSFAAMHPGWADTPGLAEQLPGFRRVMGRLLRTPEEGIDTIIWLATTSDPVTRTGRLLLDRRPRLFDRVPSTRLTPRDRHRLWAEVSALAGVADVDGSERPGR